MDDLELVTQAVEKMTRDHNHAVWHDWEQLEVITSICAAIKEIEIYLTKQASTPPAKDQRG